jgi:hypothetical protein
MFFLQGFFKSLFSIKGLRLVIAVVVGLVLASPLPLSATTTLAYTLLPAALATVTVNVAAILFPEPATAWAADSNNNTTPTPVVVLGNRLWLEDDFDGNAATGTVKSVGAGYVVRALASDGITVYTATTDVNGFYAIWCRLTIPTSLPPGYRLVCSIARCWPLPGKTRLPTTIATTTD